MAFQVKPIHALVGVGAAIGLYFLFKPKHRFKGDDAKKGDDVHVFPAQLPAGSLPALIPQGAGFINVHVRSADKDFLNGPITGWGFNENLPPTPLPPIEPGIHVPRSAVGTVIRNGRAVA